MPCSTAQNPLLTYLLPLGYCNLGLLNAILGVTAHHRGLAKAAPDPACITAAFQYRLNAIQALASLLSKDESYGLSDVEQEIALAIVFTLILHDV